MYWFIKGEWMVPSVLLLLSFHLHKQQMIFPQLCTTCYLIDSVFSELAYLVFAVSQYINLSISDFVDHRVKIIWHIQNIWWCQQAFIEYSIIGKDFCSSQQYLAVSQIAAHRTVIKESLRNNDCKNDIYYRRLVDSSTYLVRLSSPSFCS